MGKVGGKASRGKSNLIESPISICPDSQIQCAITAWEENDTIHGQSFRKHSNKELKIED